MNIDPRRHLDIEGADNVRDLGGYPTRDGRQTQWGRFLRSAGLHEVTDAGRARLLGVGLKTVVDLRRGSELEIAPSVFADSTELAYHHLDMIGEGPVQDAFQPLSADDDDETGRAYCLWLDHRHEAVGRVLGTLAAPGAWPALFNCAAGKDRTGCTAALLLGLAGVDDDVIVADYTLSAHFLLDSYNAGQLEPRGESPFTEEEYRERFVPARAMARLLKHLQENYGGVEAYMRTVGLQDDQLQRLRSGLLD